MNTTFGRGRVRTSWLKPDLILGFNYYLIEASKFVNLVNFGLKSFTHLGGSDSRLELTLTDININEHRGTKQMQL